VQARASADQPRRFVVGKQVHETAVAVHLEGLPDPDVEGVDGHVTDRTDLALGVLTADCVPVLFLAPWAVGAAHAGWRGLAGGVVAQAADDLLALPDAAADLASVVALVGPCAGPCCYEVGDEVRDAFADVPEAMLGRNVDLKAVATARLRAAGVEEVHDSGLCTMCDERFFSHRRDHGTTGRQGGVAWLT
jgi:YfiH family protein